MVFAFSPPLSGFPQLIIVSNPTDACGKRSMPGKSAKTSIRVWPGQLSDRRKIIFLRFSPNEVHRFFPVFLFLRQIYPDAHSRHNTTQKFAIVNFHRKYTDFIEFFYFHSRNETFCPSGILRGLSFRQIVCNALQVVMPVSAGSGVPYNRTHLSSAPT